MSNLSALTKLNSLSKEEVTRRLYWCCSSSTWVSYMVECLPFKSEEDLLAQADRLWNACNLNDMMEAFSHHPRIGGDLETLRKKYQSTAGWASQEQGGVAGASEQVLQDLNQGNIDYEDKFGFVFLICATGKSATEMLEAMKKRLPNTKDQEILNAKTEQSKITQIRLKKLLGELA